MSCLELVFRYPLLDGNLREHVRPLHVIPHENYILPLVERGTALLNSGGLSEDEIRCLQFYLNEVPREREDTPETFVQWEDFHEHLKKMENGTYVQSLQEGGAHTIYFRSKLDDAVTFYHLCLPKNYQPEKKYPLLISFSILRMDTYSHMVRGRSGPGGYDRRGCPRPGRNHGQLHWGRLYKGNTLGPFQQICRGYLPSIRYGVLQWSSRSMESGSVFA